MQQIKEQLLKACSEYVEQRAKTVDEIIADNKRGLLSETKSSAGDKHETGRAMLQLEMEKAGQQLASINQMKIVLARIQINPTSIIKLGSLIITDHANYFLAISAGEIKIKDTPYFAISPGSPIGKLLVGKKADDTVNFTKEMLIKAVF